MTKPGRNHLTETPRSEILRQVLQEALIGACEDHLPEEEPAEVEVIFAPDEYQQEDRAIPLCAHCLLARLEEGFVVARLEMCDGGAPLQLGVGSRLGSEDNS